MVILMVRFVEPPNLIPFLGKLIFVIIVKYLVRKVPYKVYCHKTRFSHAILVSPIKPDHDLRMAAVTDDETLSLSDELKVK